MVVKLPNREQETREIVERLKSKRRRRSALRVVFASAGGALVVVLLATALVLATRESREGAEPGSTVPTLDVTTSTALAHDPPGSRNPATTYHRVSTTTDEVGPAVASTTTTGAPPSSLTTAGSPTTSSTLATSTTASTPSQPGRGLVVCIDPGHQARGDSNPEPLGPGSSEMKPRTSGGTVGVATGIAESELVLAVSLKLRDALVERGIQVVMTRTTQDVRLSNIERARIANEAGADLFVRIHADGSEKRSTNGIHVLYPASIKGWTDDIAAASKQAAVLAQRELIAATGATDLGVDARTDMTGFNWCDVPVILPEIGFMSNAAEDRRLADPAYQNKIVAGLVRAILGFLGAD